MSRTEFIVATALLLAGGSFLVFYNLGLSDVINVNEAQRLLPAMEMAERGDWVVPTLDGQIYLNKPPLIYWIVMASNALGGEPSPLAGRMPVAVVALLLAWAVAVIGWRQVAPRSGVLAALILLTACYYQEKAQETEIDPVLTAAVFGMVLAQWRAVETGRWWAWSLLAGGFAGAALLLKGPVLVPFLVASSAALYWTTRSHSRRLWASLTLLVVTAVVLATPWCILVIQRAGWDIVWQKLYTESLERVGKSTPINSGSVFFYLVQVPAAFLPWSWLLAYWCSPTYRASLRQQATPLVLRSAVFCAASVVLFSLFSGKETEYLLPIFPFLALLCGSALDWLLHHAEGTARRMGFALLSTVAAVAFFSPLLIMTDLGTWMARSDVVMLTLAAAGALGTLVLFRNARRNAAILTLIVATGLLLVSVQDGRKRRTNALKSVLPLLPAATRLHDQGVPLYRFREGVEGTYYLRSMAAPLDPNHPERAFAEGRPPRVAVIARSRYVDSLLARLQAATVAERIDGGTRKYVLLSLE